MLSSLAVVGALLCAADDDNPLEAAEKQIVEMAATGRIADRKNAEPLAEAFAKRFAVLHDSDMVDGLGDDKEKIATWLAEHPAFRTRLFNAFDEKDDVKAAMAFFRTLWKKHAAKLEKYDDLAIASVVVWDQPGNMEDPRGQLHWTKA